MSYKMLPHRLTLGSNRKQNIISLAFELRKERFGTALSVFEMTNQHPLRRELTDARMTPNKRSIGK